MTSPAGGRGKGHGRAPRHGHCRGGKPSRAYRCWINMRQRCHSPKAQAYAAYGGRGITVCERWQTFENFLADMGEPPPRMTLERKNNDLGYEPGNCVWATYKAQNNNRRGNILVTVEGRTQTVAQWSAETGLTFITIWRRVRDGWDPLRAVTQPSRRKKR